VDLRAEIARVEAEMEKILPDAYVSDLANERYAELKREVWELKKLLREDKAGYYQVESKKR